jgi:hypothetical protein
MTSDCAMLECGDSSPLCSAATCRGGIRRSVGAIGVESANSDLPVARQVAQHQSGDKSPHSKE